MAAPTFTPMMLPSTLTYIDEITNIEDTCTDWLRVHGLFTRGMICKCCTNMREGIFTKVLDGVRWRCLNTNCKKFAHRRVRSFFEGSNLPFTEFVEFLYFGLKAYRTPNLYTGICDGQQLPSPIGKTSYVISVLKDTSLIQNQLVVLDI